MPFSIRPYRRLPVHCFVTYNAGPFLMLPLACVGRAQAQDLFASYIKPALTLTTAPYE